MTTATRSLVALADLEACVAHHLGEEREAVRVVWCHPGSRKMVLEFEVTTRTGGRAEPRGCIGKEYRGGGDRGRSSFTALSQLWEAGFRPPSPFTVVRPITYLADRDLLLQEKAPGRRLREILTGEPAAAAEALARTAGWLAALHAAVIGDQSRVEQIRTVMARRARHLIERVSEQALRIERLAVRALAGLEPSKLTPLVPSHGDFHSYNVFVADSGRVTVVDLDMFGQQERAADVGYFLAQAAITGYLRHGSFAATAKARHGFLRAYLDVAPPLPSERLALYQGMAFLQSLHYELCVLHTGNDAIAGPWLRSAEHCLLDGGVDVA